MHRSRCKRIQLAILKRTLAHTVLSGRHPQIWHLIMLVIARCLMRDSMSSRGQRIHDRFTTRFGRRKHSWRGVVGTLWRASVRIRRRETHTTTSDLAGGTKLDETGNELLGHPTIAMNMSSSEMRRGMNCTKSRSGGPVVRFCRVHRVGIADALL